MSIFGWSLPAGCGTLPGEESSAEDLSDLCDLSAEVHGVFWDEDGYLIESFPVQVPADEYAGTPAYTECGEARVGQIEWDDDLSGEENMVRAAIEYKRIKTSA